MLCCIVGHGKTSTRLYKRWREVVNLFNEGEKADPENDGGITLLRAVGKTFCKILNARMGTMVEKEEKNMRRASRV